MLATVCVFDAVSTAVTLCDADLFPIGAVGTTTPPVMTFLCILSIVLFLLVTPLSAFFCSSTASQTLTSWLSPFLMLFDSSRCIRVFFVEFIPFSRCPSLLFRLLDCGWVHLCLYHLAPTPHDAQPPVGRSINVRYREEIDLATTPPFRQVRSAKVLGSLKGADSFPEALVAGRDLQIAYYILL
jgi:hypothetical protein